MIDLTYHESSQATSEEKPIQESILDDSLNAAKAIGADADKIRDVLLHYCLFWFSHSFSFN